MFRNGKSLKDHLVRAKLSNVETTGRSESCGKGNCQVCDFIHDTDTFTTKACGTVVQILLPSQQRFHEHCGQHSHNGIDGWQFALIEQFDTHEQLKEREAFWQHRFKTFYSHGLNEK